MKNVTVCFLTKTENGKDYVCLAMKKRGFGKGKWNGVGGKVEDETVKEAVIRETQEEINVTPKDLTKMGEIEFYPMKHRVHVFLTKDWEGEPEESEEMRPKWFLMEKIPYGEMWDSDDIWLEPILKGRTIKGVFHYDENDIVTKHKIEETTF